VPGLLTLFCSVAPFKKSFFYAPLLMDRLDQLCPTRGPHVAQSKLFAAQFWYSL